MEEQNKIGWDNLLRVRLSLKWGKAQTAQPKQKNLQPEQNTTHEFRQALARDRAIWASKTLMPLPSSTNKQSPMVNPPSLERRPWEAPLPGGTQASPYRPPRTSKPSDRTLTSSPTSSIKKKYQNQIVKRGHRSPPAVPQQQKHKKIKLTKLP